MSCSICVRATPEGARFCPWCGHALENDLALTSPADALETMAADLKTVAATGSWSYAQVGPLAPVPASRDDAFEPGSVLAGRYRVGRLLGRGGMGVVYHADDLRLGHPVALKFLPGSFLGDPRRLEQFYNEVSVARQVSHPNVCRVHDIGDVDGHLFLSMEYVEGEDLAAALVKRGPFHEADAIELIRQICAGLAAVHARGVLHRDLKPANVMLTNAGRAKLMDFGIAAPLSSDGARTVEGTPVYMAPEQLTGGAATTRSDIYALGLVMHEIVSGQRLLSGRTVQDVVAQQSAPSGAIARAAKTSSPQLREAIVRCLDADPAQRPASVAAVAAMLQTLLLEARATWRRVLQVVAQGLTIPFVLVAVNLIARSSGPGAFVGLILIAVSIALVFFELRYPVGWTVTYKGHRIRFQNHPVFGERLYIDDTVVDRGRFGFNVTLRGTIETGAGAGERITAVVRSSYTSMACRIVVESFVPEH